MTHAGYFISMLIGLLVVLSTLSSEWQKIAEITLIIPKFIVIPVVSIIFVIIIVILLPGCAYALNGTFYWGYLASEVIAISVTQQSEEEKKKRTPMFVLHKATCGRVENSHPNVVKFKISYTSLLNFLTNKKNCRYCGTLNERDSIFCFKCGKKMSKGR